MVQKHLQLLRNTTAFGSYAAAYAELTGMTNYADGTPIVARYTETDFDGSIHQRSLLGIVNNGVVDVVNSVSDYILRGYVDTVTGEVTANDSIKDAISKLKNQIVASSAAATTKVVEGEENEHLAISSAVSVADSATTYTITLTDVASDSALTQEIAHRKAVDGVDGDAYTADTTAHYISGASTLYAADQALDAALYSIETAHTYTLSALNPSSDAVKEEYGLVDGTNTVVGEHIKIYKDSSLVSMELVEVTGETGNTQVLRYTYLDASGNTKTTDVDVSLLLSQNEFKSGVTANNAGIVHGVVDPTSESYLTVGEDGFKLSGVDNAISGAVQSLDVSDTADENMYVSSVSETDGKISVSRENLVNGKLSGYTKGTDSSAIATGDTLGAALGKLENQIENSSAAAATEVAEGTDAGNNLEIVETTGASGQKIYTFNLTDVASHSALTAETAARKAVDGQTGQTYAANTSASYINDATDLNNADVQLDTALAELSGKAVTDVAMTGGTASTAATADGTRIININTDGSQIDLTNYAKGTDSGAVAASDSVNEAIGKLENQVDAAKAQATTVVEHNTANTHVTVSSTTASDGHKIYTVNEDDIASATALTQEISDRESGDTALSDRLGTGVTSANTATAQLTALSGNNSSTSAETSVEGAKRYAEDLLNSQLDGLDYNLAADANKVVVSLNQTDGKVSGTSVAVDTLTLDNYSTTADSKVVSTDTIADAFEKLQGQIDSMDLAVVSGNGEVITAVSEADGKVSASTTAIKDVTLTGYQKDANVSGAIAATDDVEAALSKLENNIEAAKNATTVTNTDGTIDVSTATTGTTIGVVIQNGEHVIASSGTGLYTDLDLVKITGDTLPTNVKERYQLLATDDSQIGQNIDIYKDNTLKSVALDDQELVFTYIVDSGESVVRVDVSKFLAENEFGSGVTANSDGYVHGVVDSTSEKDESNAAFLTVGADGFKVSGIKDAIDTKINKLDVTGDTAVAGQYITHINEEDGKIQIGGRADISKAPLNDYAKGSDATAVAATDTVNQAISKLENQVDAAKAAATTEVVEGTDAGNNLSISSSAASDGHVVYTVNLTDVASASALTAEITARKAVDGQNGDTYTANSGVKYISGATSLNDADVKLANALSALNDSFEALDADVSGNSTHVTVGVVEENGKVTAVTVSENNIASKTDLDALSGKAVTVIESSNSSISAVSTAATDGTVKYDLTTDGGKVKLTGYDDTVTGTPAATDSVNAAISKLYNKSVADHIVEGSATTVSTASTGTTVDVKLDHTSSEASMSGTSGTYADGTSGNVLEITQNGLYLSNYWDCGTY